MEDFALALDRAKVLEQLIPGTEEHYYYQCLHLQHTGKTAQVEAVLKPWVERHGETSRVEEIRNRQALLAPAKDTKAALERIRWKLGIGFDHQREVAGQKTSYPTSLDPKTVSHAAWKERAFESSHSSNLSGFKDTALEDLLQDELEGARRRDLLSRLRRPDHPKLVQRIVEDLRFRHSGGFGSLAIHRLLLEAQLDELVKLVPELSTSQEWVHEKIKKLRPGPDLDWENDPAQREAYLERLWRFVGGLVPAFNSLKAHVLYHRLDLDRSKGVFDRGRFLEYLKLPRPTHYAEPKWLEKREHRDYLVQLGSDFRSVTLLPAIPDDERLVRDYLESFFEKADGWQPFEIYVRDAYLKQVFATTKILAGAGDMEKWYSLLDDPSAYQALKERVDIELAPTNSSALRAGDSVSLDVYVKNVPVLVVKVFEINTLNYLLATGREPDTSIDLDGLVASEEKTHQYPEPPLRRVKRAFVFPSLKKAGVFVVELIGNGKSSRALVRKGRLRFLERIGAAGHVFTVLDEANKPLPDATLWLGGREYKPGEKGTIVVPFTTQPRRQPIILRAGELTTLETFEHQGEDYSLAAGIFCDRESLLDRRQAEVAVRPALTIHGVPVSVSLVEEPTLLVSSTDRHGVSSTKEVPNFELFPDKESVFVFQTPEDLASITFTLKGKVECVSSGKKVDVSDSRTYTLNAIDTTDHIEDLHLSRTGAGYLLSLLGKTGEARPDRPVNLEVAHEDFVHSWNVTLQTDESGRIELGPLVGIAWIRATSPSGVQEYWALSGDACRYPATIHAKAGDPIALPHMGNAKEASREAFSLLEKLGDGFVRDHRSRLAVQNGYLEIAGLGAGDYDLLLKESNVAISLRVTAGARVGCWIVSDARLLEAREAKWLQITAVSVGEKDVQVRLANASKATRVHVSGTRFVPAHSIFFDLGSIGLLEPRCLMTARALSNYVSGRDLGDEYRYVLERKFAKKPPGNMLTRPGLLLNPWAMRKTDTDVQHAGEGGVYGASAPSPAMRTAMAMQRGEGASAAEGAFANLDFLAEPSAVSLNLRADERGIVTIPREDLAHANQITVLALDRENAVSRTAGLDEVDAPHDDRRLLLGLDPQKHVTEKQQITVLRSNSVLEVADITTSKVESYDTLSRVFSLYATLSRDATLAQFGFVLSWPKLKDSEKGSRLSEFACHELHFFISRKDRAFFEKVLVPYLRNKRAKTFLDRYLLGDDLSSHLKPWAHGRLNVVERILLAERIRADRKPTERHVSDLYSLLPRNVEEENRLFRTAIQGSALEAEDALGFEAAAKDAFAANLGIAKSGFAGGGARPGEVPPPMSAPRGRASAQTARPADEKKRKMSKKESARDKEMEDEGDRAAASESFSLDDSYEPGEDVAKSDVSLRRNVRQLWRKLETTQELGENNYYHRLIEEQGPGLVTVNAFWRDFARHEEGPFLSPHFAQASRNFTEMMFALSVLDLPFDKEAPEVAYEGARMRLRPKRETVVFHREIKPVLSSAEGPVSAARKNVPVLVSQNYFRADDRYKIEDGEQVDKYVTDELLVHTVYLAQVVLTNPTSSEQKLSVLLQIPRGAIPVRNGFKTKGETVRLSPYATQAIEYAFYFPAPGKFLHYPVHVAKDEELVVSAPPTTLDVVEELSKIDRASWAYVSQHGTGEEVLRFLDENTIDGLDLTKIAWRMRERKLYDSVLALLARRHVYQDTLWSYSIFHADVPGVREYLLHQDGFLRSCGLALEAPLATIDAVARGWYEHREYAPLVNARAHRLGAKRRILNDRFAQQYVQWMQLLCYRPSLSDDDLMAVLVYFLLQDRTEEALATFARIDPKKIATRLQHDYLRAYLHFFSDDPRAARAVALPHADHPVDRWRNLFRNVLAQLDELEGGKTAVTDSEDRSQRQGKLAATEAAVELQVENKVVSLHYQNLEECVVNYYLMDIELLFSRQPFVQQQQAQFAFIKPNRSDVVRLPSGKNAHSFELPRELLSANVIVEVVAPGTRKSQAYYAHVLVVQVIESMGELRVARAGSLEPLPRVYVKVYARFHSGEVRFYKDGYTDARGKLDYASLSTDELDAIDRFALLVLSEEHGAVIREASPPKR